MLVKYVVVAHIYSWVCETCRKMTSIHPSMCGRDGVVDGVDICETLLISQVIVRDDVIITS